MSAAKIKAKDLAQAFDEYGSLDDRQRDLTADCLRLLAMIANQKDAEKRLETARSDLMRLAFPEVRRARSG